MRFSILFCLLFCYGLSIFGQTVADDSTLTITKQLEDVEIIRKRSSSFVELRDNRLVVSTEDIRNMPKFLGTSDPIRYIQSLPGVQTNNETTTGLHIQGCDDYQTLISINSAPIYYPNHLMGLYSTFITPHFRSISIEQAEHRGTAENRIGGIVDFQTQHIQPQKFSIEGNIGLINSDLTLTIPCGNKNAIWISARSSYINWLYKKLLRIDDVTLKYDFQDFNITYSSNLSDKDNLLLTAFYSRDGLLIYDHSFNCPIIWQNGNGSLTWTHRSNDWYLKSSAYFSSFNNKIDIDAPLVSVATASVFMSGGLKNRLEYHFDEQYKLSANLDFEQYFSKPLDFQIKGIDRFETTTSTQQFEHSEELSLGIDFRHNVVDWFGYNLGLHNSTYIHHSKAFLNADPRITFNFYPAEDHSLSLHYGIYHQYFHKTGLTNGGLPTDFFFLASPQFKPEMAHNINLKYSYTFKQGKYTLLTELYFKQIYNIVESTGNILNLLNKTFTFDADIINGNGRNYGLNLMFQRNSGYVTGYVSYTLGWAKRQLPELEGITDYIYAASSERRHDLKVVLNSQVAKRWNIGLIFVLASGLPYTKAEELYFVNGQMICRYSTYNGAHMPLYNRLDLSCSYDIIKKNGHELGVNISLYNVYAYKNAQFVVYRETLRPVYGTMLSTIIPSISFYGKF